MVHEANHLAGLFGVSEELTHRFPLKWQNQVRLDIREWSKDKLSQVQPRMRKLQSLGVDLLISVIKQIKVNSSRNVLWMIAFAA